MDHSSKEISTDAPK